MEKEVKKFKNETLNQGIDSFVRGVFDAVVVLVAIGLILLGLHLAGVQVF